MPEKLHLGNKFDNSKQYIRDLFCRVFFGNDPLFWSFFFLTLVKDCRLFLDKGPLFRVQNRSLILAPDCISENEFDNETCQVNLCTPCGEDCSTHFCNNQKCAIGCADSQFRERTYNPIIFDSITSEAIYIKHNNSLRNILTNVTSHQNESLLHRWTDISLRHKIQQNTDFSRCHPLWKEYSIDIALVRVQHDKTRQQQQVCLFYVFSDKSYNENYLVMLNPAFS